MKNIILAGDMNMHVPGENIILEENAFYDLWLEKRSHFDGLTWDPDNNFMLLVKEPFDNRRLRLDRVCMKESKQLNIDEIEMVGTQPMNRVLLFPSDHFGLLAKFSKSDSGFIPQDTPFKQEFAKLPPDVHGYRTESEMRMFQIGAGTVLVLLLLYLFMKLFFLNRQ